MKIQNNNSPNLLLLLFMLGTCPMYLNGFYDSQLTSSVILFVIVEIIIWIVLPIGIYYSVVSNNLMGKCLSSTINPLFLYCSILVLPLVITESNVFFANILALEPCNQNSICSIPFMWINKLSYSGQLTLIIYLSASAAIVEEFYFRVILKQLLKNRKTYLYIIISSVLFSIIHWEQGIYGMVTSCIAGIFLATYYTLRKNSFEIIIAHFVVDIFLLMNALNAMPRLYLGIREVLPS